MRLLTKAYTYGIDVFTTVNISHSMLVKILYTKLITNNNVNQSLHVTYCSIYKINISNNMLVIILTQYASHTTLHPRSAVNSNRAVCAEVCHKPISSEPWRTTYTKHGDVMPYYTWPKTTKPVLYKKCLDNK